MPISSLILHLKQENAEKSIQAINALPSTKVTDIRGDKVVVITETKTREEDKSLWGKLEETEGVISINLVYHNYEDLES